MTPRAHRALRSYVVAAALVALGAASGSCTNSRLYGSEGSAAEADRITLGGRVCTEDPTLADYRVRVVIVADVASGPLFATYDPVGMYITSLTQFVEGSLSKPELEFAVVSYAGRSHKLAPMTGNFTRDRIELGSAISQLRIPESCTRGVLCRVPLDGIRSARALIEGDMAETPAGRRVLTQYVVLMLAAGPPSPLALNVDCCMPDDAACLGQTRTPSAMCEQSREIGDVAKLQEAVLAGGAMGVKFHVVHLASEDAATNNALQMQFQQMAFAGGGTYHRYDNAMAIGPRELDVLDSLSPLRMKTLIAANLNAKPTPSGPVPDSDTDGLSDEEEATAGTDPTTRDTDGDKIGDFVETLTGFDPLVPDMPMVCGTTEAGVDTDLDGLTDCDELLLGLDRTLVDTDGDGLPDFLEVIGFIDYLTPDGEEDSDGDGVSNADEITARTDPRSTDTRAHLSFGYRYETHDEGVTVELYAKPLDQLTGVEVVHISNGTTPGVGTLFYDATAHTLAWQDQSDMRPGMPVLIREGVDLELTSSSWAPIQGEDGKFLRVRVSEVDLPPASTNERQIIIPQTRQCLRYTIRNIRLMDTLDDGSGMNRGRNAIVLFFAESPEGRLQRPGPFRLTEIPVHFFPPSRRRPNAAVIRVEDDQFFRPLIE